VDGRARHGRWPDSGNRAHVGAAPTVIGVRAVLVAVVIGVTVPRALVSHVGGLAVGRDRDGLRVASDGDR
jgi:hypothetical protein